MKNFEIIKKDAIKKISETEISVHCWQTDDVAGFELDTTLGGGIQSTGNYPGKARNKDEVFKDLEFVFNNLGGKFRLNLHAFYLISSDKHDRNEIEYADFAEWVEFAKTNDVKIDFNPTFFAHDKADTGFTLASTDKEIRDFWIEHGKRCIKISEQIAKELNDICVMNIWIPDGAKEVPTNRLNHRMLLKDSLDQIIGIEYDKQLVPVAVESKVFGIGVENYTVGSHEFYMSYAASRGINCLVDSGHYHQTENVADKLSSLLTFNDKVALHLTRPVRWDSDHVLIRNQELSDICDEIARLGTDKFYIGLDWFDGSINRPFAYISGIRNLQKTLLKSMINRSYHNTDEIETESNALLRYEFLKDDFDMASIWNEYCATTNTLVDTEVLKAIDEYEQTELKGRA
ncbi:L-rhamnose isomerase [Mollicutes bacterium LVI A0039]|nr:L-rhamnose isomerase [Mollicutes bacterium LVI A0039]